MAYDAAMMKWHVPAERKLLWYEREGEAVVFNSQSGRSHFLNALTNEVLRFIEAGPCDEAGIEAHVTEIVGAGGIEDLDQQIRSTVTGFSRQGLIDPWRG